MSETIPKAIREGKIRIGDTEFDCAVLDDPQQTRVLAQQTVMRAIGRSRPAGAEIQRAAIEKLPVFLAAPNIIPLLSDDLRRSSIPLLFRSQKGGGRQTAQGGKGGQGYGVGLNALVFPEICRFYVESRDRGLLTKPQLRIAARCEQLLRGLAGVGITALIDEATGFQEIRQRDALQQILEAYINPELLPWTQRFPIEYFRQLFRLRNWTFDPSLKGPRYVGKLNNQLIYAHLPPGVLPKLQEKNPTNDKGQRRWRHHQLLTANIGNPHLEKQLVAVTTLMRAAPNWVVFERMFKRAFPDRQAELDLIDKDPEQQ